MISDLQYRNSFFFFHQVSSQGIRLLSGMKKIIAGEFDPTTLYFVIFFQIIHGGKLPMP